MATEKESPTGISGHRLRQARIKARLSMEGLCEKMAGKATPYRTSTEEDLKPTTTIIYGREMEVPGHHTRLMFIPDNITKYLKK